MFFLVFVCRFCIKFIYFNWRLITLKRMVLDSISKGLSSPEMLRECVFLLHLFCLYRKLKGTWPHILMCVHAKLLQLCPTLCDPMDYSPSRFLCA